LIGGFRGIKMYCIAEETAVLSLLMIWLHLTENDYIMIKGRRRKKL
jgi:hypothetical protein